MYKLSSSLCLLPIAALLLLGNVIPTFAQPLPSPSSTNDPNPNESISSRGSRSPGALLEEKKRQALQAGNNARSNFDYEKAIAAYSKAKELDPKDARAYYGLGNVYFDVYCYDSALTFYEQALQYNPAYVEAITQLAYTYLRKDRYEEAEANFALALKRKAENIDAKLGSLYVGAQKGKAREAIDGINELIEDKSIGKPKRSSAYMTLGDIYAKEAKWPDAIKAFTEATNLDPNLEVAYLKLGLAQLNSATAKYDLPEQVIRTQDKEELAAAARVAGENIQKAIEQKHYDHPSGYIFLAMAQAHQYNYQAALRNLDTYFTRIKELQSRVSFSKCDLAFNRLQADGYWWKADVFIRQAANELNKQRKVELEDAAIDLLKRTIETKEDYAFAYSRLAMIYRDRQRYEEAIEQYKKALQYQTNPLAKSTIYTALGYTYLNTGLDEEAVYYLNKAIELVPNEPDTYFGLARVQLKGGNLDETIRLSKLGLAHETSPSLATSYFLANVYLQRAQTTNSDADYEEAIKLLKEVTGINPSFSRAYLALGNVYKFYQEGKHVTEALANYEKALKYDSKNPTIYFSLGDLHGSVTHNYDAAIKYLTEAITLKPDYALAYFTLGLIYRERKDDTEAIRQYLEGLKYQKDVNAYLMLVDIYERQKNYVEATRWAQEASRAEPTVALPYVMLARIAGRQNKNDEAIHDYEEAIKRLKPDDLANKQLYLCRIVRLRRQYPDALACFRGLTYPLPAQVPYEIGLTYVHSGNKEAALAQHRQLVQLKSLLADELIRQINEMK